jgi:hypothetical protein
MTSKKYNAEFQTLALASIHESTTNPHRTFDEYKLAESADFVGSDPAKDKQKVALDFRDTGLFYQVGKNPRLARISSRSSSRRALLFLRRLKNSSRTLTTIALTLTPSASAHSRSAVRASAPTWSN